MNNQRCFPRDIHKAKKQKTPILSENQPARNPHIKEETCSQRLLMAKAEEKEEKKQQRTKKDKENREMLGE